MLPINIITKGAAVSETKLELGYCVHLAHDVKVVPGFDCVLLRMQSQ